MNFWDFAEAGNFPQDILNKLADLYGVSVDYLLDKRSSPKAG
jgi:hypothetical protein